MLQFGFINERVTTTGDMFQIGYFEYPKENKKGEKIVVEVNCCYNENTPHSLPVIWFKNGWTKKLILNYIDVRSYVYDKDGNCSGMYDFVKLSEDGKRRVIDFDWVLEQTTDNLEKMVREMLRKFNA